MKNQYPCKTKKFRGAICESPRNLGTCLFDTSVALIMLMLQVFIHTNDDKHFAWLVEMQCKEVPKRAVRRIDNTANEHCR